MGLSNLRGCELSDSGGVVLLGTNVSCLLWRCHRNVTQMRAVALRSNP
jgi:hypothetical protein